MQGVANFDGIDRAEGFYKELFGWEVEKAGDMEYWLITAGAKLPLGGGRMKRPNPAQTITSYIGVPSIDDYMMKVEGYGGKVLVGKRPAPGFGWFAICLDPEGNAFGLWKDDRDAG